MYNKKPPFEMTSTILDAVAEIAELVGQVNAVSVLNEYENTFYTY